MTTQQTVTTGDNEFTVTRVLPAPVELVWETMTTPEHLTHFWGPKGSSTPLDGIVIELRAGGRFETTMVQDSGESYTMVAEFVDVIPNEKLSWREANLGIVATSTYRDRGDGTTEVTIHQTNLPDGFLSDEALEGFLSSLDKGDAYLVSLQA
jgi:uncharacterized protein YndB with AHSA1/START domain